MRLAGQVENGPCTFKGRSPTVGPTPVGDYIRESGLLSVVGTPGWCRRSEVKVQAAGECALGVCKWGEGISWAVPGAWWLPPSHLTFVVLQTQPSCPVPFGCATLRVSNSCSPLPLCSAQDKSEVLLRCVGIGQVSGTRCCGQSTRW